MQLRTKRNYDYFEVVSVFQKCIRKGLEEDALYWGHELYHSDYKEGTWRKMLYIASEDIGMGDPMVVIQVHQLFDVWKYAIKFKSEHKQENEKPELMFFCHAILLLVRAKKSRVVDSVFAYYRNMFADMPRKEIPDWAMDVFTRKGRSLGRGVDHLYESTFKLENEGDVPLEKEWADKCKEAIRGEFERRAEK